MLHILLRTTMPLYRPPSKDLNIIEIICENENDRSRTRTHKTLDSYSRALPLRNRGFEKPRPFHSHSRGIGLESYSGHLHPHTQIISIDFPNSASSRLEYSYPWSKCTAENLNLSHTPNTKTQHVNKRLIKKLHWF